MRKHLLAYLMGLLLALHVISPGRAAGHRDWTVIPLGSFPLAAGSQQIRVIRPYDAHGIIPGPIVLTAFFDPRQPLTNPITIRFTRADGQLPPWKIERLGQTYVIGHTILERAWTSDAATAFTLNVNVTGAAPALRLMASGAPDYRLLGDEALGPLELLVAQLGRGSVREYFNAVISITVGRLQMARADFARLARGRHLQVARFARAALRRIHLAEAEARLQPDFHAHYRLGLYAQQCGLFRAARMHFEAAILSLEKSSAQVAPWQISNTWFHLGEVMARCGEPSAEVAEAMNRAGHAANVTPNEWDVWVTILKESRRQPTDDDSITDEQLVNIQRAWNQIPKMIYGASGGHLKLNTRFVEISNTATMPYALRYGRVYGPPDELIPTRGSVDCLLSFRPHGRGVSGGTDSGPRGAALSDLPPDGDWQSCLAAWYAQFDWTLRVAEAGDTCPIIPHTAGCGHQPIPSFGYGQLANLRYYLTPAIYQRLEPADPDNGAGYICHWDIFEGVVYVPDIQPGQRLPRPKVQLLSPANCPAAERRFYSSPTDFINLIEFLGDHWQPDNAHRVCGATAYVLAPRLQEVRLWLGHNDGLALWINDELIHRGDYYAVAGFEDRNLTNMLATSAILRKGWNRIDVSVESWPAPRNQGFGFSLRICDFDNQPVPGLIVADHRMSIPQTVTPNPFQPVIGKYYRWDEVRYDFHRHLPRLDARALATYLGLGDAFEIQASIGATQGFIALGLPRGTIAGPILRGISVGGNCPELPDQWNPLEHHDSQLNNILDWARETVAIYPLPASEPPRQLLFIRPEALEAYLTCLYEDPRGVDQFQGRPPRDRILGYLPVGTLSGNDTSPRFLIVIETCLPAPLPVDVEDLLVPFPPPG
ncbi:MAG: hypothetical protein ABIG44_03065 [Planctomycetota bacterium]